jgi:hypothetical protein
MSQLFGPVIQQGYVVPDIQAAMQHWLDRGIGPFFIEEHINPPGEADGATIDTDLSAAFAFSGDQQIEVIQQHNDAPTIYREFLDRNPAGGLQHLAVWVEDIDASLAELGDAYVLRQRYGDAHAYVDSTATPGVMMQLMAANEMTTALFRIIREGADNWDGVTDPVRRIDWSTGSPRLA